MLQKLLICIFFSQVMTYEGHNSFLQVSDYPLPTQKCVSMLLILIEFFEKSVQPLKHTFQITYTLLYSLLQFLAHIYLGKLIESF